MKLLNEDEKISFMKVLYTFVMRDNKCSKEEEKLLDIFKNVVFKLQKNKIEDHKWKINLSTPDAIAEEIDKIKDSDSKRYLFFIIIELIHHSDKTKGFIFKRIKNEERQFIKQIIDLTKSLDNKIKKEIYTILDKY